MKALKFGWMKFDSDTFLNKKKQAVPINGIACFLFLFIVLSDLIWVVF